MLNTTLLKTILACTLSFVLAGTSLDAAEQPIVSGKQHPGDSCVASEKNNDSIAAISREMVAASAPSIELNHEAQKYVKTYLKEYDEMLVKVKSRSKSYFEIMDAVFSKNNLPVELKYLAVVESELKATALSGVGARGPWQLMPATARLLGLKVKGKYDERIQAWKSTNAAARYLKDLYSEFGDWLLVLAAYNSGPGPVYKAIKKSGSRNFWKLQYFLPAETRAHVKKFIGVHYYFEGRAGETTQTKAELADHERAVNEFLALQKENKDANGEPVLARLDEPTPDKSLLKTNSTAEVLQGKEK
jgi:membrane-bound lytic murein transglycosylase D